MKKILFLTLSVLIVWSSLAQGFTNYKAMITDDSGEVLNNQTITVRFTIFDQDPNSGGIQVFQETHTTTTDDNGIIILNIGEENPMDWLTMDWSVPTHYLKTEYDTGSGFIDMGTQAFRTVPYAQYAYKAQNSIYAEQAREVDFNNITNVPAGLSDGDDDTHLTEAEVDAMVANNGYLTSEVDGSTTNEIQNLSLNNNELSISDGNMVTFTDWDTDETDDVKSIDDLNDAKTTSYSIYVGSASGNRADSGEYNTALGSFSLAYVDSGSFNTAVGRSALFGLTSGRLNTAIGVNTLNDTNGSNNTGIGYGAGQGASGSGNIYLGHEAGKNTTGDNKLYISNHETDTPLIFGDFSTNSVTVNGNLQITGGNPEAGKVFTCDAGGNGSWETPADQTDADFFKVETTETSTDINDDIYHMGRLVLGNNALSDNPLYGKLEITPENAEYAIKTNRVTDFNSGLIGNILFKTQYDGDFHYIDYYSLLSGSGSGRVEGIYLNISVSNDNIQTGVLNYNQSPGSGDRIGVKNHLTNIGNGEITGTYNYLAPNGDGRHYGTHNELRGNGNESQIASLNQVFTTGSGQLIGTQNIIGNNGSSGEFIGTNNSIISYDNNNNQYGTLNNITANGTGEKYGSYNYIISSGTGTEYGSYNRLEKLSSVNGLQFGSYNYISGPGNGDKYGVYAKIDEDADGQHTAVYAEATKTGSYAGIFVGDVVVSGKTEIEGKLTTLIGGDSDMKAYVYGRIYGAGTISNGASSGGFTVEKLTDVDGHYKVTLTAPATYIYSYLVTASIDYSSTDTVEPATAIVQRISESVFEIYTYRNSDNSHQNYPVSFVVYKK